MLARTLRADIGTYEVKTIALLSHLGGSEVSITCRVRGADEGKLLSLKEIGDALTLDAEGKKGTLSSKFLERSN
jgi:hypothetical protein